MRVLLVLMLAACGGGGGFPVDAAPDAAPPGGRFMVAWTVTDTNQVSIPCNRVGAQVVSISLRNLAQAGGFSEAFSCNSLTGMSQAFPPGEYEIMFKLTGLVGDLAVAPVQQLVQLVSNQTTTLQPLTFAVNANGALELNVSANQTGGNCGPVGSMGAGIQNTTIVLRHTDNSCEPVTFAISAGAMQPAGSYTVNCNTPVVAGCIESDQELTVSPVPSGNYRIQIRGKIGGVDCWTNDDTMTVPPLGMQLKSTLNLVKANGC